MIRRSVFQWLTCRDPRKPSGRDWARQLGISHTWLQKLVRRFQADPSQMWRLQRAHGDPRYSDLCHAQALTGRMREEGESRGSHLAKVANFFRRHPR